MEPSMSENSKQLTIISVFIAFFISMIIYAKRDCGSLECWGSSAQKGQYIDNPRFIVKLRKTNKYSAFSHSFARAKVLNGGLKNYWFADWWNQDHWEYSIFPLYSSKKECYRKAYTKVSQLYSKDNTTGAKSLQQVIKTKAPVRCFPGGTPIADRWNFKR